MLILLDLDGTIIDSEKCHFNSYVKGFERNGITLNSSQKKAITSVFGMNGEEIIKNVAPFVSKKLAKKIEDDVKKIAASEEIHNIKIIDNGKSFLEKNWKKNFIVLATNSSSIFTEAALDYLKIKKYFKGIITPNDVKNSKPHPDMINKAVKDFGFEKKDCLLIGDSIFDCMSAEKAGVRFIAVLSKSDYKKELKKSSEWFNTLGDVKI